MKLSDIKLMYKYNYWANEQILKTTELVTSEQFTMQQSIPWGSLRGTLVHMLDTEWAWRMLLQHRKDVDLMKEEDFPDVATIRLHWEKEKNTMRDYLNRLTDENMNDSAYTGNKVQLKGVLWYYLWHVVNHGGQHRSECAVILTNFGHSPSELDLTEYIKNVI